VASMRFQRAVSGGRRSRVPRTAFRVVIPFQSKLS
jgi:hypothetical protein